MRVRLGAVTIILCTNIKLSGEYSSHAACWLQCFGEEGLEGGRGGGGGLGQIERLHCTHDADTGKAWCLVMSCLETHQAATLAGHDKTAKRAVLNPQPTDTEYTKP